MSGLVIPKEKKKYKLKYDDRLEFEEDIEDIENLKVKSNKVDSEEKDDAVIKVDNNDSKKLVAVGCGKAKVTLVTGETYEIKVKPAKISLVLMVGQSNMEGSPSNKDIIIQYQQQYILNEEGSVYNTYGPSNTWHAKYIGNFRGKAGGLTVKTADKFVPDTLTDNDTSTEWSHTNNITDAPGALGKTGIDSAFASEWADKTGEKIWVVNAAHAGSSITSWDPSKGKNNNFWESVALYKACERVLNKEIKAGHYKLSEKGYMWMQGEEDHTMSFDKYIKSFTRMHKKYREELKGSSDKKYDKVKKDISFGGILMVRAHKKPTSLIDLLLTGPRKALYYMSQSKSSDYKDVYLASQLSEVWVSDKGVESYFKSKYGTTKEYAERNIMRSVQNMPTTLDEIHITIHYSQLGYNEIGRDAAKNILYATGIKKAPKKSSTKIDLVSTDGYTPVDELTEASSSLELLAKVFPTWQTKQLAVSYNSSQVSYDKLNAKFNIDGSSSSSISFKAGNLKKSFTYTQTVPTTYY